MELWKPGTEPRRGAERGESQVYLPGHCAGDPWRVRCAGKGYLGGWRFGVCYIQEVPGGFRGDSDSYLSAQIEIVVIWQEVYLKKKNTALSSARFIIQLLMKHVNLSLRMLTGRERNVLKKSAKISSSSRIMRFVEPIISVWGEEKKKKPIPS